jgi:hypothetical protein
LRCICNVLKVWRHVSNHVGQSQPKLNRVKKGWARETLFAVRNARARGH